MSLHIRKPRKKRRVMGCELSRQLRSPVRACDCSIIGAFLWRTTMLLAWSVVNVVSLGKLWLKTSASHQPRVPEPQRRLLGFFTHSALPMVPKVLLVHHPICLAFFCIAVTAVLISAVDFCFSKSIASGLDKEPWENFHSDILPLYILLEHHHFQPALWSI